MREVVIFFLSNTNKHFSKSAVKVSPNVWLVGDHCNIFTLMLQGPVLMSSLRKVWQPPSTDSRDFDFVHTEVSPDDPLYAIPILCLRKSREFPNLEIRKSMRGTCIWDILPFYDIPIISLQMCWKCHWFIHVISYNYFSYFFDYDTSLLD